METRGHEPWEARWQLEKGVCPWWGPLCLAKTGTQKLQWDHPLQKPKEDSAKSLQSCLTLCDPMDRSLPGFSVHRILQARILGWVTMPSSRESCQLRIRTHISYVSCMSRHVMKEWVRGRAQKRGMKCRGRGQSIGGDATQVLSPLAPPSNPQRW